MKEGTMSEDDFIDEANVMVYVYMLALYVAPVIFFWFYDLALYVQGGPN